MAKVAIIYYSQTGTTHKLAQAVEEGARGVARPDRPAVADDLHEVEQLGGQQGGEQEPVAVLEGQADDQRVDHGQRHVGDEETAVRHVVQEAVGVRTGGRAAARGEWHGAAHSPVTFRLGNSSRWSAMPNHTQVES